MEPILYIGITQSLFAGLSIFYQKPKSLSNRLLALGLFFISFDMVLALIVNLSEDFYLFATVPLAYGPLLFIYTKSLLNKNLEIGRSFLIHFIPFVIFFTISIIFSKLRIMDTTTFMEADSQIILRILYSLTFFLSITGYSLLSYRYIISYQRELKNQTAYTNTEITLNWLKGITILFFAAYCLMFVAGGIQIFSHTSTFSPVFITYFGLTFFAFLISFYGIRQPVLFGFVSDDRKSDTGRYERSGLNDSDMKDYLQKLQKHMQAEKSYLNPELTVYQLANDLDISRHHLTQVINEKLSKNFYTFVNEYRLEEFKERLKNPEYKNLNMLAIAYDSGFNSKSTFNDFFKKTTGKTPSQYKKSIGAAST